MNRPVAVTAVAVLILAAAVTVWRVHALPAAVRPVGRAAGAAPGQLRREVRVAYHIHSKRSDGTGTPAEIAAAAAAAALDVVILTDHGDGTRASDPAARVNGVLVIDAVEISTWAGHYVAIGARASPYPLGGAPGTVVDDVERLGGLGIAAHPASAKDDLKWRDWDAPFGGLEWLNADSEWRDRPGRLWDALVTYPWAPVRTVTALLDRPAVELREWDRLAARRPVVGLAAHDAHARLGLRGVGEPYDGAVALRLPGYAAMFEAFSTRVIVEAPSWGVDAARDAAAVIAGLRAGGAYTVISGRGDARVETFTATSAGRTAGMGGHLVPAGTLDVLAESDVPPSATTTLVCNGRIVASSPGPRLTWTTTAAPGACRLEVTADAAPTRAPWIVTNPIYLRADLAHPAVGRVDVANATVPIAGSGLATAWAAETSPGSSASLLTARDRAGRLVYDWRLAAAEPAPFAALRLDTPSDLPTFDRLVFRASANRPMRMWLQLRTPAAGGHRWGASVYLDETPRQTVLPFDRLLSIDRRAGAAVPLDRVTALLLVADTVHARPGDTGRVTFDELWLAR